MKRFLERLLAPVQPLEKGTVIVFDTDMEELARKRAYFDEKGYKPVIVLIAKEAHRLACSYPDEEGKIGKINPDRVEALSRKNPAAAGLAKADYVISDATHVRDLMVMENPDFLLTYEHGSLLPGGPIQGSEIIVAARRIKPSLPAVMECKSLNQDGALPEKSAYMATTRGQPYLAAPVATSYARQYFEDVASGKTAARG